MPKIYDYLGIVFFFYSNEHEPLHVHARYGDYETIFIIVFDNGILNKIETRNNKGFEPLPPAKFKEAKNFVERYAVDIAMKWHQVFVLKQKIVCEEIKKKI